MIEIERWCPMTGAVCAMMAMVMVSTILAMAGNLPLLRESKLYSFLCVGAAFATAIVAAGVAALAPSLLSASMVVAWFFVGCVKIAHLVRLAARTRAS